MISLKKTPIFSRFLKKLFELENIRYTKKLQSELFLIKQCKCTQCDCATVTLKLKKRRKWAKNLEGVSISPSTNKGILILHFFKKGYLELEAICYDRYPYKKEIDLIFNKRGIKQYKSNKPDYLSPKDTINKKEEKIYVSKLNINNFFALNHNNELDN